MKILFKYRFLQRLTFIYLNCKSLNQFFELCLICELLTF